MQQVIRFKRHHMLSSRVIGLQVRTSYVPDEEMEVCSAHISKPPHHSPLAQCTTHVGRHQALIRLAASCAHNGSGEVQTNAKGGLKYFIASDSDQIRDGLQKKLSPTIQYDGVLTRDTLRGIQEGLVDILLLSQVMMHHQ